MSDYLGHSFSVWSADQQMLSLSRMLAQPCLRESWPKPHCPTRLPFLVQVPSFQSRQVLHKMFKNICSVEQIFFPTCDIISTLLNRLSGRETS